MTLPDAPDNADHIFSNNASMDEITGRLLGYFPDEPGLFTRSRKRTPLLFALPFFVMCAVAFAYFVLCAMADLPVEVFLGGLVLLTPATFWTMLKQPPDVFKRHWNPVRMTPSALHIGAYMRPWDQIEQVTLVGTTLVIRGYDGEELRFQAHTSYHPNVLPWVAECLQAQVQPKGADDIPEDLERLRGG